MSLLNRDLECFLAICESRSLSRAAAMLGVTQPALTRSLQRLEARFATPLFVRAPRGVELTQIGSALKARAEKARLALDDAEKEIEQLAAGKSGKIRIGAGHTATQLINRSLFPRFIAERPAAQIQIHVAFNVELFELVDTGRLDLAVCGLLDTPPPNLEFRELFATQMAVVVRSGHPLTRLKKPSLDDLVGYRAAAPGLGVRARKIVEERLKQLGLKQPPHAVETNSWETLLDAIAGTDLYSLAPTDAAFRKKWEPRLVAIEIPGLDITQHIGIVTRSDAYLSPLAVRAIELIELYVAEHIQDRRR